VSAVLFAPHNDDETLFAFHTLTRTQAHVIVVLRSFAEAKNGGPTFETREAETACAMRVAGATWEQWHYPDDNPDWKDIGVRMVAVMAEYDSVIAPAFEEGGHEHHNELAKVALWHERDKLTSYLTYKRGHGRSEGVKVEPTLFEREQKKIALSCYQSQIEYEPTAYWFGDDQREFVL
jgi:LmbE family N-acetylglucosaminyl deacetylase